MSDYTPTTDQVRDFWASEGRYIPAAKAYGITDGRTEFDRWLADHDAEIIREAAVDRRVLESRHCQLAVNWC